MRCCRSKSPTTSSSPLFKSLRYPCRRRHGVLERRLVQPGHSVRNLCITQVQQRGPGRSLGLGRFDLVRSLGRSDSLPEDFILRCRDLLAVTLSVLVLRKCSLGIHVQRCIEVEWRLISCCGLHWRGSGERGAWSWIPGLAVAPRSSHGRSGWSHGSPGLSLGLLGPSDERTDGALRRMEEPLWRLGSCWRSSRRGWSPSGWKRLVHPLACPPDSPALPIHPLLLLEEVLDHPNHLGHQNVTVNYVMTPPSRHLLGCQSLYPQLWSGRPLWQGRHLWPSRPLLPSRPLWLGHCL